MDILQKKLRVEILTNFEKTLSELNSLDQEITAEEKEIEEKSAIVVAKSFFFKKRVIDLTKVNRESIEKLMSSVTKITGLEQEITAELRAITSSFKPLDDYERRFVAFLSKNAHNLFQALRNVREIGLEIREYLTQFTPSDLKEDLERLNTILEQVRKFIRQLQYYSEFWEKRIKEKPFIDANIIIKTDQYKKDVADYSAIKKEIFLTEEKIETFTSFSKKLHALIKIGIYSQMLHAYVNQNIRIIYRWDASAKILTYERIINHDELDRSYG